MSAFHALPRSENSIDDLERHHSAGRPALLRHPDGAHAAFADLLQRLVIRCRPPALLVIRENCQATAKTASQNYLLTPPPGLALAGWTPFDAQRLLSAGLEFGVSSARRTRRALTAS